MAAPKNVAVSPERQDKSDGKEALRRYAELPDKRSDQRKRLGESRGVRRAVRSRLTLEKRAFF